MATIVWADWYALTFVVISATMSLVALAYMIAIGFHLPKLLAWAKEEFYQALASALIAVLLISFVSTITTTMISIYGKDPFDIAIDYIKAMVSNLTTYFFETMALDAVFALMQGMVFKAMPSQIGFNINPFAGMTTLTSMLSLMMEGILGGMAIMLGQGTFLIFVRTQLSIVLPIGIALRAFPWSRPAGGALIAIFLSFYVFYPFLWVFDSAIYNEISNLNYISPVYFSSNAAGLGSACTSDMVKCTTNTPDVGGNAILSLLLGPLVGGTSGGVSSLGYAVVYYLFVFVFIMSLFNLLTVLVLTNELAKIFGSEIDLGGLSGLI